MYQDHFYGNQKEVKVSSKRYNSFPALNNGSLIWEKLNLSGSIFMT